MGLDLLDTPVRLTWDFPAIVSGAKATGQTGVSLPAIANTIVDGGVFFVTLQNSPLLHPAVGEVLNILAGGCQLLITCHGSTGELTRLAQLPQAGYQLLLDTSGFIDVKHKLDRDNLLTVVQTLRQLEYEPVLSLTPLQNNLCNINDLLSFCSEHQISKFKLPNAHIGDSVHSYSTDDLPRWQDLDNFRKIWLEFVKEPCKLPAMEIHDLFLWEIMTPGQQQNRSEYGGCQAGNSLGHVDGLGVVHPCAAWPQPLGLMPDQSLDDIWAGQERLAVREHIAQTPGGCLGCSDLNICFGGCRGLAFHLNRSEKERDLMCSGPR
jgi:GeoRSP system SPASM domain protein